MTPNAAYFLSLLQSLTSAVLAHKWKARGCLEAGTWVARFRDAEDGQVPRDLGERGQISIDRIVALRSSVLPIYVIIRPGGVTTADEVSEDGNDFLTTRMFGDQIAFQSIGGEYLSTEGGEICTRRYCSSNERFTVEKQDTQYAFRSCSGQYLSVSDRAPFVTLAAAPGETEAFQLFSLMMYGVNVGQQLEMLDRPGMAWVTEIWVATAMREVAGLAVWLASLTSAATEGTTSEPFNCDWGRHNWHMGWSNPKKIYCCQHHQIGCEDHAPAQIVKGTSEPFNCDWGRHNWHMGWSNPKKIYCCQHHQIGCEDHAPAQIVKEPASNSSHAIPPWWVVAGVHPDGPETDYGPYRMAGFSVAQQRQFGVDATGHVQNWHRFTAATRSLKPCIDPKQQQMGLNQKEMMHLLGDVLTDAWKELRKDDPALQDWTRLRSNCQEQCMAHVLSWSLRTLWATGELLSQGGGASFGSVLADAVRTCYPGFRTLRADEVAHKVSKLVSKALEERLPIAAASGDFASRRLAYNQGPSCLEPGQDEEQRQQFATQLEMAVERAVKTAVSKSWGTMEQSARPCQQTCRRAVVRQAAEMLWDAGLLARGNADMLVMTSVEGALAACLVNLPKDAAEALAGEAMLHMRPPTDDAQPRALAGGLPSEGDVLV
ncbi:unnamed protein product [Cladocopium goreaui]|uniref:Fascin-like domain-containing protein n=1 Tax=Cladocopium goreaui TaxID=2562237 RepID=A0A9P1BV19_9DINO|nr:unnamed protein product [Cladocopium goreaui]